MMPKSLWGNVLSIAGGLIISFVVANGCTSTPSGASRSNAVEQEPIEVTCTSTPKNCEYEILRKCPPPAKFEKIGPPKQVFFSTEIAYKVKYRCLGEGAKVSAEDDVVIKNPNFKPTGDEDSGLNEEPLTEESGELEVQDEIEE